MSASRRKSSAVVCAPVAMPMLAVTVRSVWPPAASRKGALSASVSRSAMTLTPAASDLIDGVAPAQAALGHLVERGGTPGREAAEQLPRLAARSKARAGIFVGHPAGECEGGDDADALEAAAHGRGESRAAAAALDHALQDVVGAGAELVAEVAHVGVGRCLRVSAGQACALRPSTTSELIRHLRWRSRRTASVS